MKPANSILSSYGTTIFEVMSRLAQSTGAVNLGQGTPEGLEPAALIAKAAEFMHSGPHQYAPMMGMPVLRHAVAEHQQHFYQQPLDWEREVMITSGATEALAATLFGLIEPGDEVVVFEPAYDSYIPILRRAGAIPRRVPLSPPHWEVPADLLRAAVNDRTKLIIVNTPTNPCAKVFSPAELHLIAELAQRHDVTVLCDEVYEHLVFDGGQHQPLMTFPGMRDRCVRVGSFGKIFSITNWKVGYLIACPALMHAIARTHQYLTFCTPVAPQLALAWGLSDRAEICGLAPRLQQRRDRLARGLAALGFRPLPAHGTYFLCADYRDVLHPAAQLADADFCRWAVETAKVAAIPLSAFYTAEDGNTPTDAGRVIRFCFAKTEDAIDRALAGLAQTLAPTLATDRP